MNVVLGSISGSLIGFIVASLVRPPYPFFKFTIIQIGIGKPFLLEIHFNSMDCIFFALLVFKVHYILFELDVPVNSSLDEL